MAESKGPGRRRGMTKDVVQSRRILDRHNDLKEQVEQDVLDAYAVIRGVMKDESATPATRRQCAGDIIAIYDRMHKDSIEVVKDFEQGSGKQYDEEAKRQKSERGSGNGGVLKFTDKTKDNG